MTTAISALRKYMVGRTSVLTVCVLAVVLSVSLPEQAGAYYTSNWCYLTDAYVASIWEDGFYNYDHKSQVASNANVDWPVTIVFTMDADLPTVKNALWGYAPAWDGTMWDWVSDNRPGGEWHGDKGSKSAANPLATANHMRPYAPHNSGTGKDQFYNLSWNYYCVGTTHWDNYPSLLKYGYSENAEHVAVDHYALYHYVWYDYYYFYNYEPYRVEGDHRWDNDGWASEVMFF